MNDLDIVAVRIEHPCRVVARIVRTFNYTETGELGLAKGKKAILVVAPA
jgi:FMN-dependent NADH-azoreductase